MPFILEDLSPDAIVKAMENNFFEYYHTYTGLPGGEIHREQDCTWFVSGVPERWFNGVGETHFKEENAGTRVENIMDGFRRKNLPMHWSIGPSTTPANLGDILISHGLKWGYDEPGMALDLNAMNEATRAPANFTIEPVIDQPALREWAEVWLEEVPGPVAELCKKVIYGLDLDPAQPWRTYLGRLNGKAVATIRLFYAAGIVSCHHVATLSEAQGRGIGTALTVHALREARQQGYRAAALTATPAGKPVYEKIGFRTYATFSGYNWYPGR